MKNFDPYKELGVPKDATADAVKAASRAAYKRTHPDAGGDVEAFGRSRRAEMILLDPERRKKFDETGNADDLSPDNTRAAALQVIESFMASAINSYLTSDFSAAMDPRRIDLVAAFKVKMGTEIAQIRNNIEKMNKAIGFFRDMISRLETDDTVRPLERSLENQIRKVGSDIETSKNGIEVRELAVEIVGRYKFRFDQESVFVTTNSTTVWPRGWSS